MYMYRKLYYMELKYSRVITYCNVFKTIQKLITVVIHEGNTKEISTMTVTLYLIKLIEY